MSFAMNKAQREAFLAETRVGIVSVAESGRGPLTVPVWFSYEAGGPLRFVTGGGSRKAALIRRAGRISLCAQTERPPYKYVSVEGPVTVGPSATFGRWPTATSASSSAIGTCRPLRPKTPTRSS
ncbi:MAG: pyridoxamine 5'-phosphate oxidase family protein [Candidatus Rokubacteria bacterium]|nr:pyridoxamine 5'-phosphate oxidase family protein [Candidatus Rokubacteria bacterium]